MTPTWHEMRVDWEWAPENGDGVRYRITREPKLLTPGSYYSASVYLSKPAFWLVLEPRLASFEAAQEVVLRHYGPARALALLQTAE